MQNQEPPVFQSLDSVTQSSTRTSEIKATRRSLHPIFLILPIILLSLLGMVLGFMVGDRYGRQHSQYDNPDLREHYAGKCYEYMDNQIRMTLQQTLDRDTNDIKSQHQKIDEILAKMMQLERSLPIPAETSAQAEKPSEMGSLATTQDIDPKPKL